MTDLATLIAGFADAFTAINLAFVIAGVVLGQMVGAIPGLSAPMAIAIAVPFTFTLDPLAAIAFLIGVGKGGTVGGAVPAILINTPGTPDAAATALDGFPLARRGKPLKALKMALYSSVTGDTFSDLVLITIAAPLAIVALKMGPVEVFAVMVLSMAVITGLVGESMAKGIIAAALGLLVASVGLDPETGTERLQFGLFVFYEGLPLGAVAIGMLAVSEILKRLAEGSTPDQPTIVIPRNQPAEDRKVSFREYWSARAAMARGAVIGTIVGSLPGVGSTAAAFLSYGFTRSTDKEPDTFGKGNIKGIAASESANSAVMGANLIPLLTLGIPGNVTAALIISAFMIQGIQPGPLLFNNQGQLIYGLFGAMLMANAVNFGVGNFSLRLWARIAKAPSSVIFPVSLLFCITGVYVAEGTLAAVIVMLVFGLIGYLMSTFGIPVVAFIISFVLAGQLELTYVQARIILRGDAARIIDHPVAMVIFVLALLVVYLLGWRLPRKSKTDEAVRKEAMQ